MRYSNLENFLRFIMLFFEEYLPLIIEKMINSATFLPDKRDYFACSV